MALGDRKSSDIFNKNAGGSKDAKSIDTSKETEIKNKFDRGEHIEDAGMFENLAPALYAIQQLTEDIEELRRYITAEVGDGAQGPQGPAGPKGDKGDTGARGADGTTPTITDLNGSSLPTRSGSRGTLWNDRGTVKVS